MKANGSTPLGERVWSRIEVDPDPPHCWNWTGPLTRGGYARIRVNNKSTRAHRVVWQMLNGPITDGLHVLHNCDNKRCIRPDHLRLGTHQDNMRDMNERHPYPRRGGVSTVTAARGERHGTHTHPETVRRGEQQGGAKLTDEKVREIRRRAATGESLSAIARAFDVTRTSVNFVVTRRSWAHIA